MLAPKPLPPPARPLFAQADDADKVKAILLSSQTERLLLNTNWKVRSNLNMRLRKRATQFGRVFFCIAECLTPTLCRSHQALLGGDA